MIAFTEQLIGKKMQHAPGGFTRYHVGYATHSRIHTHTHTHTPESDPTLPGHIAVCGWQKHKGKQCPNSNIEGSEWVKAWWDGEVKSREEGRGVTLSKKKKWLLWKERGGQWEKEAHASLSVMPQGPILLTWFLSPTKGRALTHWQKNVHTHMHKHTHTTPMDIYTPT